MPNREYPAHVQRELSIDRPVRRGDRGMKARRIQEWLTFHQFATTIDDDFGEATERCVLKFQESKNLPETGIVDEATWQELISPLAKALVPVRPAGDDGLPEVIFRIAKQHLVQHPIELGGDNRGAWVRVYLGGNEGREWKWCAGFITFVMKQACMVLERPTPIPGSYSCDSLAYQAREAGLFVRGRDLEEGRIQWSSLGTAQIFLVRNTSTDWTHTGFSFEGQGKTFSTIEGNTNDEGSNNGYEVCQSVRAVSGKDFIRFPE